VDNWYEENKFTCKAKELFMKIFQIGGRYLTATGEAVTIKLLTEEQGYQKGILHRPETREQRRVREMRQGYECLSLGQLENEHLPLYSPSSQEFQVIKEVIEAKIARQEADDREVEAERIAHEGNDGSIPEQRLEGSNMSVTPAGQALLGGKS
jgi:hypothetical protein